MVAGEASGDMKAGRVLEVLRRRYPRLHVYGMGSDELRWAGAELVADASEIAVVGITEVLGVLGRAREIFAEILAEVDRRGTRLAVLVDFPEFNLRLAKALERRGVTVVYYVSPQIWAWRRWRVKTIARYVSRMLVLFPFEVDFYADSGVPVTHVGHPLVDEVAAGRHVWDDLEEPPSSYRIALLPGSRRSEVKKVLPIQLAAAERIAARAPVEFVLMRASTVPRAELEAHLASSPLAIEILDRREVERLRTCHLALCAAGTATLEVGLYGTPMVVVHRVSVGSYLLGRLLVRLEHASLVNLILGRQVVPELLQGRARPELIASGSLRLLTDRAAVDRMREGLAELREAIGPPGASGRAADEIGRFLGGHNT
jgi:lipid-A-disaccharide synthase